MMFEEGNYYCRQNDTHRGWLNDKKQPSAEEIAQARTRIEEKEREREEHERIWVEGFRAGYEWRKWHEQMMTEHLQWWNRQGIRSHQIDEYELGWMPDKKIQTKEGEMIIPAYTIPIRTLEDWEVVGVHYRIADPPAGVQKYRYQAGIQAREFYAGVAQKENAIIVEGAKKAMVLYDFLEAAIQVIGLPGNTPSKTILSRIANNFQGQTFIALDPGCQQQSEKIKASLLNARIVSLPGKPDDLVLAGMTRNQFRAYVSQSR